MADALFWTGSAIYFVGAVWLIYHAWTNEKPLWAVGIFCVGWIVGPIYTILNFDETKIPGAILGVGLILQVVGRVIGMT